MKQIFHIAIVTAVFFGIPLYATAEDWKLDQGRIWARQGDAIKMTHEKCSERNDRSVVRIDHTGDGDWAFFEHKRIPVKPGDIFQMNANLKLEGDSGVSISVVTRKKDGTVVQWTYANKGFYQKSSWTDVQSVFVVPEGIETIEPRIVGYGAVTAWIDGFSIKKTGVLEAVSKAAEPLALENRFLSVKVDFADNSLSITDKRTGRNWKSSKTSQSYIFAPSESNASSSFRYLNLESYARFDISLSLEPDAPELVVGINSEISEMGSVACPPPFESKAGDRLIIPMNEGIAYPVEEKEIRVGRLIAYGGHGICMAFWGQIEDASGSGMMGILETPDDAEIVFSHDSEKRLQVGAAWAPSMKQFRYPRALRFVFFDKGGHVAVCKRYREYAKKIGLFVPFTEKVKKNPNIDKLLGAANIWYMGGHKLEIARQLKELGIDRMLWSSGGGAQQLEELNKMENVLTSRYDIYQDIMDPARFGEVKTIHGSWTTEAWPHDINWTDPDGTWRKGWAVTAKDETKPRIHCAVICDSKAVPYARKRISKELETKPYTARFIDTTVAAPWFECYHPDHPMTRSDSRRYKMELLKLMGDLGLVCGSETGHDASVPFCDYFEGMLSLGPYRVHESGRNMSQIIEEVPPQIERFQVNAALRLPLWELVYHDCTVAQWYWGDYNNKLPKVWRKRDLFNALYGTPPMYLFTDEVWKQNKERFGESFKTAGPVSRATAYAEMTDHRVLSPNRLVQQTVFSNGVKVTVNFAEEPFQLPDGSELKGLDWKMEK